jgi:predicted nuclease of predicted toxin-antitoxin system
MKLLLDENLSRRLIPFLQHDYPGSSQVVLLALEAASDSVVWQTAKDHGYVIVTRDADFEELSLGLGPTSPGDLAQDQKSIACSHAQDPSGQPDDD